MHIIFRSSVFARNRARLRDATPTPVWVFQILVEEIREALGRGQFRLPTLQACLARQASRQDSGPSAPLCGAPSARKETAADSPQEQKAPPTPQGQQAAAPPQKQRAPARKIERLVAVSGRRRPRNPKKATPAAGPARKGKRKGDGK